MTRSGAKEVKWYHWSALAGCSAMMIALGAVEAMQGADPSSRFFAVDTWVVRALGVGLVVCAFWLPLRHDKAFVASMWLLGLTIVENLATYRFEAYPFADTATVMITILLFVGLPILVLAELRSVFRLESNSAP